MRACARADQQPLDSLPEDPHCQAEWYVADLQNRRGVECCEQEQNASHYFGYARYWHNITPLPRCRCFATHPCWRGRGAPQGRGLHTTIPRTNGTAPSGFL